MLWFKKKTDERYELDDEDREQSKAIRTIRRQTRLMEEGIKLEIAKTELELKKAELEQLKYDLIGGDEEEDSLDSMGMNLISRIPALQNLLNPNLQQQAPAPLNDNVNSHHQDAGVLSDEQMNVIYNGLPKSLRKQVRKMDDTALITILQANVPNISPIGIDKAIQFIRNQ